MKKTTVFFGFFNSNEDQNEKTLKQKIWLFQQHSARGLGSTPKDCIYSKFHFTGRFQYWKVRPGVKGLKTHVSLLHNFLWLFPLRKFIYCKFFFLKGIPYNKGQHYYFLKDFPIMCYIMFPQELPYRKCYLNFTLRISL